MMRAGQFPEEPSLSDVLYLSLRLPDLCSGAAHCHDARVVCCRACGAQWQPSQSIEPCPECGKFGWIKQRCSTCPGLALEDWISTAQGRLANEAMALANDLHDGFTVQLEPLDADLYAAYEALREVRETVRTERESEERQKQQRDKALQAMKAMQR